MSDENDPVDFWRHMAEQMVAAGVPVEGVISNFLNAALDLSIAHYGAEGALVMAAQLRAAADKIDKAVEIGRA